MAAQSAFSYRTARSGAITVAIAAVIAIESVALHFAIAARHPALAWTLSLTSLLAAVWIIRDYVALGAGAIRLDDDTLHLTIGRRFDIPIPLAAIESIVKPTFRDLPAPGTNQGRDYLNLTKPAAPNVLIRLTGIRRVRIAAGISRDVRRIALKVDDPAAFLAALEGRRAAAGARSA